MIILGFEIKVSYVGSLNGKIKKLMKEGRKIEALKLYWSRYRKKFADSLPSCKKAFDAKYDTLGRII